MKNVAVILSGCGVYDGTEIHEAVLTLLNIERHQGVYQCFAPNITQHHVIDHITGKEKNETRNVLVEAARIARGNIKELSELSAKDFDAVIVPGGFGAAKNLCNLNDKGHNMEILPQLKNAIQMFILEKKPIGLICIAPAMAGRLFESEVRCTIGNDKETAAIIEKTGAHHIECNVDDIVVDEKHRLVTTPAYMLAQSTTEADAGISKLVNTILAMT